jgi:hypothetical protein
MLRAVMCARCGYDLSGLAEHGVCSECALSVAESVGVWKARPSGEYLRPLHRGAALVMGSCIACCGFMRPRGRWLH